MAGELSLDIFTLVLGFEQARPHVVALLLFCLGLICGRRGRSSEGNIGTSSFLILHLLVLLLALLQDHLRRLDSGDASGQAVIAEFDRAVFVDQNIGRFQVSVDDFAFVQVLDCAKQVVDDRLNVQQLQVDARLHDLLQVTLCELHHHIDRREVLRVDRLADLDQIDDARVAQLSQESHFSQDALAVDLVFEDIVHLLDSHSLTRGQLRRLGYLAVAALS
mmetsp:Transcript_18368/g.28198  ORF Transcript_18368/g.28198 Transcript_18368/m.28198 type:complete len:220 (-) Transcript_18368:115-774(-)